MKGLKPNVPSTRPSSLMRIATYILVSLGLLAWSIPILIIARILLGYEHGVFGFLVLILASNPRTYVRLVIMSIGVLFSLIAPIWLRNRGHSHWALGTAIASLASAFVFVYLPIILLSIIDSGH